MANGYGEVEFCNGSKYKGNWVNNCMSGTGEMLWPDGTTYKGGYFNDKQHGHGILNHSNSFKNSSVNSVVENNSTNLSDALTQDFIFEGNFENGCRHGPGAVTCCGDVSLTCEWNYDDPDGHCVFRVPSKGLVYDGIMVGGVMIGPGKLTITMNIDENNISCVILDSKGAITPEIFLSIGTDEYGEVCMGGNFTGTITQTSSSVTTICDWHNGKLSGLQTCRYADGSVYIGNFNIFANTRHGNGTYTHNTGCMQSGQWVNDFLHGYITSIGPNGSKYEGEWDKGVRCGFGRDVDASGYSYVGHWKNDLYHGHGVSIFPTGETYDGEWNLGVKCGQGTWKSATGDIYTGSFVDNAFHGHGKYIYNNATVYEGEYICGKRSGQGTVEAYNEGVLACIQEGTFINDEFFSGRVFLNGVWTQHDSKPFHATVTYPTGHIYVGDVVCQQRHGEGVLTYPDGYIYKGQFEHSLAHGFGVSIHRNGEKYVGDWVHGIKCGIGIFSCCDDGGGRTSEYIGQFQNNTLNGKGVYKYSNGIKYEATYVDGKRNGYGTLFGVNGVTVESIYVNDCIAIDMPYLNGVWKTTDSELHATCIYPDGSKYQGGTIKNMRHDTGTMVLANGDCYGGEWVDDMMCGKGECRLISGSFYTGEFLNGLFNGYGECTYSDGRQYHGNFLDHMRSGEGMLIYSENANFTGIWKDNILTMGVVTFQIDGSQFTVDNKVDFLKFLHVLSLKYPAKSNISYL